jgi:hypothetical protein
MTTKEAIYRLIDSLDEETATVVLDYVRTIVDDQTVGSDKSNDAEQQAPLEWMKLGRPTSEDDPLWKLVGIAGPEIDVPSDLSRNHDKYLADIYADLHDK